MTSSSYYREWRLKNKEKIIAYNKTKRPFLKSTYLSQIRHYCRFLLKNVPNFTKEQLRVEIALLVEAIIEKG